MPFLAAADWFEILAALIFFLITGLAQWLQKRAREKKGLPSETEPDVFTGPGGEPAQGMPPVMEERRPVARDDWEEQLRRLLEGEQRPAQPPPTLTPTPLEPPGSPYAETARRSRLETESSWDRTPSEDTESVSLEEHEPAPSPKANVEWAAATRLNTASQLAAAAAAFRHASSLSESVGTRLRQSHGRGGSTATTATSSPTRSRNPRVEPVRSLLRQRQTLRQVILASVILEPPKGLG